MTRISPSRHHPNGQQTKCINQSIHQHRIWEKYMNQYLNLSDHKIKMVLINTSTSPAI